LSIFVLMVYLVEIFVFELKFFINKIHDLAAEYKIENSQAYLYIYFLETLLVLTAIRVFLTKTVFFIHNNLKSTYCGT
jgi:hypothetical protein